MTERLEHPEHRTTPSGDTAYDEITLQAKMKPGLGAALELLAKVKGVPAAEIVCGWLEEGSRHDQGLQRAKEILERYQRLAKADLRNALAVLAAEGAAEASRRRGGPAD